MRRGQKILKSIVFFLIVFVVVGGGCFIVFMVNTAVVDHYEEDRIEVAERMADQVVRALITRGFDADQLNDEALRDLRDRILAFVGETTPLRELLVISPANRIIASTLPELEGQVYQQEDQLALLSRRVPGVVNAETSENEATLDYLWPILFDGELRGHLRMVFRFSDLAEQGWGRYGILVLTGVAYLSLLLLFILPKYRRDVTRGVPNLPEIQPESDGEGSPGGETPGGPQPSDTVFSSLTRLYARADDLDKTFKESEQKIHYMMRVLNQGFLVVDLNMRLVSYNEFLLDVFQFRTSSNADRKVYEIFRRNPRLVEMYRLAADPLTAEVKKQVSLLLLNGKTINIEVLAQPFTDGERMVGVIFYMKNLIMLKELEDSLQRSMKYGVISQLASSIGHEIRNPLSSLAIHTEIVDTMVERSVDDETKLRKIKKSIGILNSEVERLNKLIDQFFKLARSQSAGLTFDNVNDLMDEVVDLVYQQALENNINITKAFSDDLPLVRISRDQIKQVIINLILNAYDAIGEGGDVTLATAFRDGKVVISVRDNGPGIPENVRDNVFDLYFTTKDSGGGIGLAISRKIIEAHEGRLYFETKTGKGTVFTIELPTSHN